MNVIVVSPSGSQIIASPTGSQSTTVSLVSPSGISSIDITQNDEQPSNISVENLVDSNINVSASGVDSVVTVITSGINPSVKQLIRDNKDQQE